MRDTSGEAQRDPRKFTVERRSSPRAPVVVRVDYSTVDAFFSEFSSNINEGGLFVETEQPPEPGTVISLRFFLPGGDEPVKVRGRVAWTSCGDRGEPSGMGVEFEELDPSVRERINALVRQLRADN